MVTEKQITQRITANRRRILNYLESGKKITVTKALYLFSTVDLRKYISDLRAEGHPITDEWVQVEGKRFKRYFIDQTASLNKKIEEAQQAVKNMKDYYGEPTIF